MIKRAFLALLPFASPVLAEGFSLALPIDCDLESRECYIQQYVDRDAGAGFRDFTCGSLSYDGHKGTDFALPTLADMEAGVAVLAAAPGTVVAVRDGMPDSGFTGATAQTIEGRECGNGVLIRHPGGWETQYCHLRKGSIVAREGQKVSTGARLGLVGQSGRAQFPHIHLSVRKDGEKVDPFNPASLDTCGAPPDETLWAEPVAYQPGGLIGVGFSSQVPDFNSVKAGRAAMRTLTPQAPALVLFAYAFGTRKGDTYHLQITGPDGEVLEQRIDAKKNQALAFRAAGRKKRGAGWTVGEYEGRARLIRDGEVLSEMTTRVRVE